MSLDLFNPSFCFLLFKMKLFPNNKLLLFLINTLNDVHSGNFGHFAQISFNPYFLGWQTK